MPFHVARRFIIPPAALLGCVVLFLLSELPTTPTLACCGMGMGLPFFCFLVLMTIFSIVSFLPLFLRKNGAFFSERTAFGAQWQQLTTLALSVYLRGRFYLSLFLSSTLILVGAALVFSLSSGFVWLVLALGCLSILLGLGILLLGLCRTRSLSQDE